MLAVSANWKAEATGGGLQIILPPKYLLTVATSGLHLPISGGFQNVLPPKKIPETDANREAEATGDRNQNILRAKKSLEGGHQCLRKKSGGEKISAATSLPKISKNREKLMKIFLSV